MHSSYCVAFIETGVKLIAIAIINLLFLKLNKDNTAGIRLAKNSCKDLVAGIKHKIYLFRLQYKTRDFITPHQGEVVAAVAGYCKKITALLPFIYNHYYKKGIINCNCYLL